MYLRLDKMVPADPDRGFVPYYHYRIHLPDKKDAGHINFRVGDTPHILLAAGHIGYAVNPDCQGKALSYYACKTLAPFVRSIYSSVILTVDPDNTASIRTIEKLGASFINEVIFSPDDPHYANGARIKRRYEWHP